LAQRPRTGARILSAAILVARFDWLRTGYAFSVATMVVWAIGLVSPYSPVRSDVHYGLTAGDLLAAPWPNVRPTIAASRAAIRDDRWSSFQTTGLLTVRREAPLPDVHAIEQEVRSLVARHQLVVVTDRVGLFAFVSGTRLHVVDPLGRTDPLLARLPPADCCTPRGDTRAIPDGYLETIETGSNVIADTPTAELYRQISTLTKPVQGDVPCLTAARP
jgi:hypothetical protein